MREREAGPLGKNLGVKELGYYTVADGDLWKSQ